MNDSGRAVAPLVRRYGIADLTRLVVVHDELDLPLGTVRVKAGGGLAGHNGLRSIKAHLHSDAFTRVRIGIGKPPGGKEHGADHVLRPPSRRRPHRAAGQHRGGRRRRRVHPRRRRRGRPKPVQWVRWPPTRSSSLARPWRPSFRCFAAMTPSRLSGISGPGSSLCRSRRGRSPSPASPRPPAGAPRSWRSRASPRPSAWPRTCRRSSAPSRSRCAPPGRRCPLSGSARAWRPWAAGSVPCGGCAAALRVIRIVFPRFWWPRFGPSCSGWARTWRTSSRSSCRKASKSIPRRWWPGWLPWATGANTRSSIGASSPFEARSLTCSVRRLMRRCGSTCGETRLIVSPSSRSETSAPPTTWPVSSCSVAASCCPRRRSAGAPAVW